MKLTRLIVLMLCVIGLVFGLVKVSNFPLEFSAANAAANGQIAPVQFVPGASRTLGFVTNPQMWILIVLAAAVLLLALVMLVLSVWNRIADTRPPPAKRSSGLSSFSPPRDLPPAHRPFGRPQ